MSVSDDSDAHGRQVADELSAEFLVRYPSLLGVHRVVEVVELVREHEHGAENVLADRRSAEGSVRVSPSNPRHTTRERAATNTWIPEADAKMTSASFGMLL